MMASNVSTVVRSELLLSPGIIQESSLSIRSVFQSPCSSVPSEWFRDDYLFTESATFDSWGPQNVYNKRPYKIYI